MAVDTTEPEYWLNWKFSLCALWVYSCMVLGCFLIWKYEGASSRDSNDNDMGGREEAPLRAGPGVVYLEDCWKPCIEEIHPGWLLALRLVAFFILASILVVDILTDGWSIFLYYTQWTFLFVTLYFGLGSVLSIYGCYQYAYKTGGDGSDPIGSGADHGTYIIAPTGESVYGHAIKSSCYSKIHGGQEIAGFWGYLFQIMFQTNAGAVMITDLVFWLILYPFLAHNEYDMNFILIGTHSINVVFLVGDAALNKLHFPWFRIAYFLLWTGLFVNVQWIIHANVSIWWPYPFLDLTFPGAPVCYDARILADGHVSDTDTSSILKGYRYSFDTCPTSIKYFNNIKINKISPILYRHFSDSFLTPQNP